MHSYDNYALYTPGQYASIQYTIRQYIVYTYSITVHSYDNYALYTPLKGDSMQVYNIQLDSITIHSVYLQYNGA